MRDFAFYNAGVDDARGPRLALGLARRALRRVLRPMFFRQEAIYRDLQAQIDQLSEQVQALGQRLSAIDAMGWDHVAMARRLASIEDRLAASRPDSLPLGSGRRADPGGATPAPHAAARPVARSCRGSDPGFEIPDSGTNDPS